MTTNDTFVLAAYGLTAIAILALVAWVVLDQRARRGELVDLEKRGVHRRSARPETAAALPEGPEKP